MTVKKIFKVKIFQNRMMIMMYVRKHTVKEMTRIGTMKNRQVVLMEIAELSMKLLFSESSKYTESADPYW